jgi:phosphoribosylglycinamide formyltransferase-1
VAETVLGVLVSGRGSNLQAILDAIGSGRLNAQIGVVISDNPDAQAFDRLTGTGIPAVSIQRKTYSHRNEFESSLADTLEQYGVNLVILAGFMRILSSVFLRRFPNRVMNVHPSLLPAFPGLDAQAQAIRYGVKLSGCTVHFVDDGIDSGPIILQQAVEVLASDTADTLSARILQQEHLLYPMAISLYSQGRLQVRGRQVTVVDATEDD